MIKVLCAVSGGVDSTVLAVLLIRAIGENLIAIYIDNGLMRRNEGKEIVEMFKQLVIKFIILMLVKFFLKECAM